jgi:leucyl aminopeptidase
MEEEYNADLKSKIADLKNLGGRYGGAIAAALFSQEFVKGDKPLAHVDTAGPVWNAKAGQATGWGSQAGDGMGMVKVVRNASIRLLNYT